MWIVFFLLAAIMLYFSALQVFLIFKRFKIKKSKNISSEVSDHANEK